MYTKWIIFTLSENSSIYSRISIVVHYKTVRNHKLLSVNDHICICHIKLLKGS